MLRDRTWQFKYTAEHGNLVQQFHVPTLENAVRYDRLTGYFNATALALAARGIEGLVRNRGHMRLVVGCTLEPPEIEAIKNGERLRKLVEWRMTCHPLDPPDPASAEALELLAWMVAREFLDVRVAVPCNVQREPVPDEGIFHEKTGIVEDQVGDRLAWTGSVNETGAGWQNNWESVSVYTSWGPEPGRVDGEDSHFARIWSGEVQRVIVLDVPEAVSRELLRFKPATGMPRRLEREPVSPGPRQSVPEPDIRQDHPEPPVSPDNNPLRDQVWAFIRQAPSRPGGGQRVGEATAPVTPWPHQSKAFARLNEDWPPRLLIADEVGLGKTIQAGMLLRQAWLAGRAKRILILAPKAVLGQWQIELREKFNLNWPIYDSGKLEWYRSPAFGGRHEHVVGREEWHQQPAVIASSQLMRRKDRRPELLKTAEPWDLVVLDEAHHARRRSAGGEKEGGPNTLLRLIRGLRGRTQGLVLLTATPMQMHPVEVWDLLDLLGLPEAWTSTEFLRFFEDLDQTPLPNESMDRMASLFRSAERAFGTIESSDAQRLTGLSILKTKKVLRALRDTASIPRRLLDPDERKGAVAIMRACSPVRRLISRNTRELLRGYFQKGMITTPVAERKVNDLFLDLTGEERAIYDSVENYIAGVYSRATGKERTAVGFVMTVYRRRLASSFVALRETLRKHKSSIADNMHLDSLGLEDDVPDDDAADEVIDADEAVDLERTAVALQQEAEIDRLLAAISRLPQDSKLGTLKEVLRELRDTGNDQVMVFTQYTDTMDFLRGALLDDGEWTLLCFSGRGGEVPEDGGVWRSISRDEVKERFRKGQADILVCTDAAAEGLNFQFCSAIVNYDMPWNPMRVEQRIGRIDRLGQKNKTINITNLHYKDTIETDIYRALHKRIGLFQSVVGRLQPILSRLSSTISRSVLEGKARDAQERTSLVASIERDVMVHRSKGFDIDEITSDDLEMPKLPEPAVTIEDLQRIVASDDLMPPDVEVRRLGQKDYELWSQGMDKCLRITTDPEYFEQHAESIELWSPGNPLFIGPKSAESVEPDSSFGTLKEILDQR